MTHNQINVLDFLVHTIILYYILYRDVSIFGLNFIFLFFFGFHILNLGCVWFGWKPISEINFRKIHVFGCHGKHYFPGNDFRLTTNFTFDPEMNFSLHFHFNSLPGLAKRRERERKNRKHNTRAREKERKKNNRRTQQPTSEIKCERDQQICIGNAGSWILSIRAKCSFKLVI